MKQHSPQRVQRACWTALVMPAASLLAATLGFVPSASAHEDFCEPDSNTCTSYPSHSHFINDPFGGFGYDPVVVIPSYTPPTLPDIDPDIDIPAPDADQFEAIGCVFGLNVDTTFIGTRSNGTAVLVAVDVDGNVTRYLVLANGLVVEVANPGANQTSNFSTRCGILS